MKLNDYLDVRVICETGSLRKAAEVLGVTQPTLSNRIAHFEARLGVPLFDRSRGRSQPTDLALFIARRATAMAEDARRLATEVKRLSSGQEGMVRIGVGPALTRVLAARIVGAVQQSRPGISLELVTSTPRQLAESLVRRELDLAVCDDPDLSHESLAVEPMLESSMVVVGRPDHPFCARPPADIRDLLRYPIAMPHITPQWTTVLLQRYGVDLSQPAGRVVCSDFETLVRVVAGSPALLTVGPRFAFHPELESGTLATVNIALPLRNSVSLFVNQDAYPLPAVEHARRAIRAIFEDIRATT